MSASVPSVLAAFGLVLVLVNGGVSWVIRYASRTHLGAGE